MNASSIRSHLLLLVLAVSVPLTAAMGYGIYRDMQLTVAHTKTELRILANMMINNTGSTIESARRMLERLAERPLVKRVDPRQCDEVLKDLHSLNPGYSNIVYTDLAGLALCSAIPQPGGKPVSVGKMAWFRNFMEKKKFSVGQPHFGPISGKWVSVLSTPILNSQREMVGSIHLPLDLSSFDPHIPARFLSTESRYGFLADDGVMVWRNLDPEKLIGVKPTSEAAKRIVEVKDGEFESLSVDNRMRFYSVASMPEIGWIAFIGVPSSEVYAAAKQRAIVAVAILCGALGLLMLLAVGIARRIAKPVAELEKTARAVHGGDLGVRAKATGPSEIAAVACEFNAMLDARQRIDEQLREHRENLAALVQQRTVELSKALDAAQLADRAKDAFLANMSHELRTPLNAVIGLAGMARDLGVPPKQRDYLEKILDAGKHLSHIVDDLLDLSKIVAGHLEMETIAFDLHRLLLQCASVMRFRAAEKGIELIETIDADTPSTLLGDPHRLKQILLNLLSNAIKFTASGKVEIHIRALDCRENRVHLQIRVEDTGIGMRPEELDRLFKPFSQANVATSRHYGGAGLGLAISKHLAEMMDGAIVAESRYGQGSRFTVELRLGVSDAAPSIDADAAAACPTHYDNVHILVAEDQEINREIVAAMLAAVGIAAQMTNDGQAALDALIAAGPQAFDLVLMDMQMPVMDGLTATRELRRRTEFAALPIVAMTAHTMTHEKQSAFDAGMNDHIGKPFDNDHFYRILAKWLPAAKRRYGADRPAAADEGRAVDRCFEIDIQAGIKRFNGNEARYRHWLGDFIVHGPAAVAQIQDALSAGRTETARQAVHALKGHVGMLALNALHPIVAALEAALKRGEAATDLLEQTKHGVERSCRHIQTTLGLSAAPEARDQDSPDAR